MTTVKKAAQANYSAEVIAAIVGEYKEGRENGLANAVILAALSAKYGKTIASLRAKLASLKVYQKDADTSEKSAATKAKKGDIVQELEALTALSLASLEAVTKTELQALADYIDDLLTTIHELKGRLYISKAVNY